MHDNHSFQRLDQWSVEDAMQYCEHHSQEEGCGFVGFKGEHKGPPIQWHGDEPWRDRVKGALTAFSTAQVE